jgi:heme-degrading monooxygenase HmoA
VIRVSYRWTVDAATEDQFIDAWREATERIRAHEPGALGSTLLRPANAPNTFVGFARWQQRENVEAFWASGNATPLPGATLESIEIMDEIEDMTRDHIGQTRGPLSRVAPVSRAEA